MRTIIIAAFVLLNISLHAQNNQTTQHDSIPATIIGGQDAWRHFLEKNIHSQTPADHGAKPGTYTVIVSFLVDTTGKVSDVQIINDPGYGTAKDVLNAFKHCPDWTPATINGKAVKYRQKQNIYYQVSEQ
jgi:protein TonB